MSARAKTPGRAKARRLGHADWMKEGEARFGADMRRWAFVCPSCSHVATVADWEAAGAPESAAALSCVGRWLGADGSKTFRLAGGPCNYAGGGLISLNPVEVVFEERLVRVFEFAPGPATGEPHPETGGVP